MSLEADAIIAFVRAVVPTAPVTATTGRYISPADPCSPHTAGSLHCADGTNGKGRAVDFGGDENMRLAVFHALEPQAHELAELFHNGPGVTRVVKNGMWADGLTTLGQTTWAAHQNHVHVAVPRGVFLTPAPTTTAAPPSPPAAVHDFEEATVKQTLMRIGPLDEQGNGWGDWDPGLGRDPNIIGAVLQGPSPPDDGGYWPQQQHVTVAAQPRGGKARVVIRNGTPSDTVGVWVTVS